jgi:hypothetical protein
VGGAPAGAEAEPSCGAPVRLSAPAGLALDPEAVDSVGGSLGLDELDGCES